MKKMIAISLAVAGLGALAACASTGDYDEAGPSAKFTQTMAKFDRTGQTRQCLSLTQVRSMKGLDDQHFLVTATGGRTYLNTVSGKCSGAGRSGNRIEYRTSGSSLCSNEIVRIVDNASDITNGTCGLGQFELLEKKEIKARASY